MFRVEDSPSPSCIVAEFTGNFTALDYTLAQRAVQRATRRERPLSLVIRVGSVGQVSASPELSDLATFKTFARQLTRAALVTDDASVRQGFHQYMPRARTYVPSFAAETRVFAEAEYEQALAWACAGVATTE